MHAHLEVSLHAPSIKCGTQHRSKSSMCVLCAVFCACGTGAIQAERPAYLRTPPPTHASGPVSAQDTVQPTAGERRSTSYSTTQHCALTRQHVRQVNCHCAWSRTRGPNAYASLQRACVSCVCVCVCRMRAVRTPCLSLPSESWHVTCPSQSTFGHSCCVV